MAAYHQMGHDSWNLLDEESLRGYAGIVLSPVNDTPTNVVARLQRLDTRRAELDVVLDPQFYNPTSEKGKLSSWGHLVDELDTADTSSAEWWNERCKVLVRIAREIGANAVCSPAMLPRHFDDEYYAKVVECAGSLLELAAEEGLGSLLTAVVPLADLAQQGKPERIASQLTANSNIKRIYLVLYDTVGPRDQRADFATLGSAGKLIRLLEGAGTEVMVAFSGLDMLLWKAAGAQHVVTGKFFNLRRFVPGRFDDEGPDGGRVIPYFTDDSLIAWLREDDLRLLMSQGFLDIDAPSSNPYSKAIFEILKSGQGEPWVALGWRQYLHWFQQTETILKDWPDEAINMLRKADAKWGAIAEKKILFFDRKNSGDWIRPWLNAIHIFGQ